MSATRKVTDESLAQAARIIHDGGLIVIPTDTVYGVACDPRNAAAIARIYELKRRPRYKALQVLLDSTDQLDELGLELPSPLNRLLPPSCRGRFRRLPSRAPIARWRRWPTPRKVGLARKAFASPTRRSALRFFVLLVLWPLQAPIVPAMKARRPWTRPWKRSGTRLICIWMAGPHKAIYLAPW